MKIIYPSNKQTKMPPQFQNSPFQPLSSIEDAHQGKHARLLILTGVMLFMGGLALWFFADKVVPEPLKNLATQNTTTQTNAEFADWKTYRNDEYGFEFKYPPQFETYTSDLYTVRIVRPEDRNITIEPVNNLIIRILDNGGNLRINEWWSKYGPYSIDNNKSGVKLTTFPIKNINIGGIDAIYIGGSEGVLTNYAILAKDLRIFEIMIMIPDVDKILSTFKFISTSTPLISEETENIGLFNGYYTSRQRYWTENTGPYNCDEFVVIDGEKLIMNYFIDMAEKGNSINEIDENGNLILQISLVDLAPIDQTRIKSSSPKNPIQLTLKKKIQHGKGAPTCVSFFDILEVK